MNKIQLDTVIGKKKNQKVLLTMYIVETHFMLIFLLDKKDSLHVTEVFLIYDNSLKYSIVFSCPKFFYLCSIHKNSSFLKLGILQNEMRESCRKKSFL